MSRDSDMLQTNKKKSRRPNGAYKLLVHLVYGQYSHMERMSRGYVRLNSICKLARQLGTESARVNRWLEWLHLQGYIEDIHYSQNRRVVHFRIRSVSSVSG